MGGFPSAERGLASAPRRGKCEWQAYHSVKDAADFAGKKRGKIRVG